MKKIIIIFIVLVVLFFSIFVLGDNDIENEKAAIKNATLDYLEGWYDGDAERMERALHPDLNKRGVQVIPNTGRTVLSYASASMMVEYTRAGLGKMSKEKQKNEVTN